MSKRKKQDDGLEDVELDDRAFEDEAPPEPESQAVHSTRGTETMDGQAKVTSR
jgi:hypothetical protein